MVLHDRHKVICDIFIKLLRNFDTLVFKMLYSPMRLRASRSRFRYPVWPHIFVAPSADSTMAVVSYWRKYVHEVLVDRLGGLKLPRKSVVRLTVHPDMSIVVYRGRITIKQQAIC